MSMNTQSYVSDELTHFVGKAEKLPDGNPDNARRYALLLEILGNKLDPRALREGWLQASYREEFGPGFTMLSDGRKRLSTNEAIKCTMLCFCDIPQEQLSIHIEKYGEFGIAFSKQFLLRHGAFPVHYVPRNACYHNIGVGSPRTVAERFDALRADLQRVRFDLEEFVARIDGPTVFLSKLPAPNTPVGHQVLGRFSALQTDFDELVFGRMKFFTEGLPENHEENFYMEREWRLHDGLAFRIGDIARIFLPLDFRQRFREDIPEYAGPVHSAGAPRVGVG